MSRVLIVSTDVVGPEMAGPGIRAWEMASALAREHQVTLAAAGANLQPTAFQLVAYPPLAGALLGLLSEAEVVIGQGFAFQRHPELLTHDLPLAIDLYDPLILESLDLYAHADLPLALERHHDYQSTTEAQLDRGDFFFCATDRQRDYWLGALTARGRLNPLLMREADRDLLQLIDLVPSGIAASPPQAEQAVLRGVHPAIPPDALLLLWAGGLWDWFDPQLIVRAVAQLRDELPQLRLVFQAGARPNPDGAPFRPANEQRLRQLAAELGVMGREVVLLDDWVPYAARGAYLAEADIGVSAHLPGIETRFAFRTRLLDYLWARLPIIVTAGDSLGEAYAAAGGALTVAPQDVEGWCAALRRFADPAARQAAREALEPLARRYQWDAVVEPLRRFCAAPRRYSAAIASDTSQPRVVELEQALEERLAYVRHLEAAHTQALSRSLRSRLRRWLGK